MTISVCYQHILLQTIHTARMHLSEKHTHMNKCEKNQQKQQCHIMDDKMRGFEERYLYLFSQ